MTTKDGVKIVANVYDAGNRKIEGWLILSHMMVATKESWRDFAVKMQNLGYESLAIDLRGHGESRAEGSEDGKIKRFNCRDFSDGEHQKSILDLESAVDYLIKERRATSEKIVFVGASIGANLSLRYISEHREFKKAVLLSPGLDYKGIKTEPMVKNLKSDQKIFFVSSRDDEIKDNAEENQKLYDLTFANTVSKIKIYEFGGHGTEMLKNQKGLINLIIDFIKK